MTRDLTPLDAEIKGLRWFRAQFPGTYILKQCEGWFARTYPEWYTRDALGEPQPEAATAPDRRMTAEGEPNF